MNTLTANDAKRNFGELLLSAQREPVRITKNNKEAVIVMSIKDYEVLEQMKKAYLEHCFQSAHSDVESGETVDARSFISSL
jgi:prevent-host-death family protein